LSYDVAIAGAGPAGSALGTLLARAGLSVALVDKCQFPRSIPCGGMISPRAVRAAEAVFGPGTIEQVGRASSTGCRMFYGGRLVTELDDLDRAFFVDRAEMDALFLSKARGAGCAVIEGDAVTAVGPARRLFRLDSGREIDAAILVGADGGSSVVRRTVRRWRPRRRRSAFGLVADVPLESVRLPADGPVLDRPHIHFGVVPWGYGWVFPKGGCASVGVAGVVARTDNFRGPFDEFVSTVCTGGTLGRLRVRGRRLPAGDYETTPASGNVLLVGDAAGFIEPLTGEGIAFALECAPIAALAITDALRAGRPATAGGSYAAVCRRAILPTLRGARLARRLFYPAPFLRNAVHSLARHPEFARWFMEILAGTLTYPAFFRRVIGRRLRELTSR